MTRLLSYLVVAALTAPLAGCIVATRPARGEVVRECPPAHHWENGYCVHNGHGHGDHDRDHRHD